MMKRHGIQVLRRAGHGQAEVAKLTGVSERSVRRVEGEAAMASFDTAAERAGRGIGRPSKAEPFRDRLVAQLVKEPEVLAVELVRRMRLAGYAGGKSALYGLIKDLRPARTRPVVRFAGLPGEFSQHDFGQVVVRFLDGKQRRVHFLASRLKHSRHTQVSVVRDERVESLVRALVDHFAAWGGVPLLAVFDRPKTIVLSSKRDGAVGEWNPIFAAVALDLGLGVELCWPRSPEQKGSVENLVGWVKGSFFKQRRFLDDEDLLSQLATWHEEVNSTRPSRATGVVPAQRLAEERLRPLRIAPAELALRWPIVVGARGYVCHEGQLYSMPPESIGLGGTLYLYRDKLRIAAGHYEAVHARRACSGEPATLPEHRSERVAAIRGKRARRYLKRQHLVELGSPALAYLTELVHRRPGAWSRDVDRLHELLDRHGDDALRTAFTHALADGVFGHEYVAHYLASAPPAPAAQAELPQ